MLQKLLLKSRKNFGLSKNFKMRGLFLIVLNIIFFVSACDNEDEPATIEQINFGANGNCMNAEMDGLTASLCVLDQLGNPIAEINQGENFIVSLSFTNDTDDIIKIKKEYLRGNSVMELFGVDDRTSYGKPYTSVWCAFVNDPYMTMEPGETYVISSPWRIQDGINPIGPICKAESNENLLKGNYQVEVRLQLTIEKGGETIEINSDNNLILNFNVI